METAKALRDVNVIRIDTAAFPRYIRVGLFTTDDVAVYYGITASAVRQGIGSVDRGQWRDFQFFRHGKVLVWWDVQGDE